MKYIPFFLIVLFTTSCFLDSGMGDVDCGVETPFLTIGNKTGMNIKTINEKLEYKAIGHDGNRFYTNKIIINNEYNVYDNGEIMPFSFEIELDTINNNIYFNLIEGYASFLIPKQNEEQSNITYGKIPTYEDILSNTRKVLYSVKKNDVINRNSVTHYTNIEKGIIRDSTYSLQTINSNIKSPFEEYNFVLSSPINDTLYLPIGFQPHFCNVSLGWIECMFKGNDFYINEIVMAPHKYY